MLAALMSEKCPSNVRKMSRNVRKIAKKEAEREPKGRGKGASTKLLHETQKKTEKGSTAPNVFAPFLVQKEVQNPSNNDRNSDAVVEAFWAFSWVQK